MKAKSLIAAGAMAATMALGAQAAVAAPFDPLTSSTDGRPWWDPTKVIEVPVNPDRAEGHVDSVKFTDPQGSHTVHMVPNAPTQAVVQAEASGFTPGLYYTVRVTLREAGTGADWGVYTWLTYKATDEGKLHIKLNTYIPSRAQSGEKVVAVPTVYNANDVRQDGRPNKQDPKCVLECKRVPPLAAWTNYNDPQATITIG
ncbi:hypothetical protein [Corynebacterium pseudopelargi]|uniref:Uncharacterized protein n=1 Tax=Corynebacterium pseudopelargi TaxID=2080757 RepID=A0A3G6IZU3_9CORY|nr:hypothetical protein [Corynebacterium pseudopelargi]AZA10208.1 hypothetical protein CPPEL_10555 [Corynebacterium pseudopelargi]